MKFLRILLMTAVMIAMVLTVQVSAAHAGTGGIPDINSGKWVRLQDGQVFTVNGPRMLVIQFPYRHDEGPKIEAKNTRTGKTGTWEENYWFYSNGYCKCYYIVDKGYKYTVTKYEPSDADDACLVNFSGTLSNKKTRVATVQSCFNTDGQFIGTTTTYMKVKAPANGTITMRMNSHFGDSYNYSVQLCNSKKKPLNEVYNENMTDAGNQTIFGVKKGTYYVAVKGGGPRNGWSAQNDIFDIAVSFQKRSITKAGASKEKASTIKVGQKVKCMLYYGEKAHRWYKVRIPETGYYYRTSAGHVGPGDTDMKGYIVNETPGCQWSSETIRLDKGTTVYFHVYNVENGNGYFEFTLKKAN